MANDKQRILFVDDEVKILDTFRVGLRKKYKVDTAEGPEKGIEMVRKEGPYACIVSDLKMPGMDGIEFLSKVAKLAPDSARIMLTGHGDLEAAALAVNRGKIFRFLNKPTPIEEIERILEAGVEQYQLLTAEKELLKGTLRGSLKVLTEFFSVAAPEAFGRAERIKRLALRCGTLLKIPSRLKLELAAMLSQIGCASTDDEIIAKLNRGEALTEEEASEFARHPALAARLLNNIPRMKGVVRIIATQLQSFGKHPNQPLEARILKAAQDYDFLSRTKQNWQEIANSMQETDGVYDSAVLEALLQAAKLDTYTVESIKINELKTGMILNEDLKSPESGILIMSQGQEVTLPIIERLRRFIKRKEVPETIRVITQQKK